MGNNKIMKTALVALAAVSTSVFVHARGVWSAEKANEWFKTQPYRAGINYFPSYAANGIDFWQKETFNIDVIEKELKLASSIGFNAVRIWLSPTVWKYQRETMEENLEAFLKVADKYGIGTMIVFFGSDISFGGKLGEQPYYRGRHGGVPPGIKPDMSILTDKSKWGILEKYVKAFVTKYADDPRVICWDIYNEPGMGRSGRLYGGFCVDLVKASAKWARDCNPSQPITFGLVLPDDEHPWEIVGTYLPDNKYLGNILNKVQCEESDIISYHSYSSVLVHERWMKTLKRYNKPIMCTEWMGRIHGSTFIPILGYLKEKKVWAFSFGLVEGKAQFHLPWPGDENDSGVWFHYVFRSDHTPYCPEEVEYIKRILGKK